jgi:alanine-glyoxylate transaminase / serine-glyoxylate transaminase / serine-pyruvate transaminase
MADRRLLMIPGPIEFEPDVLAAMGEKTRSHLDPAFIEQFGSAIERTRKVFCAGSDAQPFIIAGSGTLAMDMAIANLVSDGDAALCIDTGYFSARMADVLTRWGARVHSIGGKLGDAPSNDEIAAAMKAHKPRIVTVTHVDTSTGVRTDIESIARIAREHEALVVVDGVCSVGGEVLRQEQWGVDLALTASQKALGTPPGLAVMVASPRAMAKAKSKKVASIYLDFAQWLPVMEAYEARKPFYFATPAVNLVAALDVSLGKLLAEGMDARFARHQQMANAFRAAWKALELKMIPREGLAANTLSAVYYPDGIDATFPSKVSGIVVAGGLHPEAKTKYFRVGHMGAVSPNDVLATVGAIERALGSRGEGLSAAHASLCAK